MTTKLCQEIDIVTKVKEIDNNLTFIFCRPKKENYYYYSINSVDDYRTIDKYELKAIISYLDSKDVILIESLFSRFRSFIYLKENDTIMEVTPDEAKDIEIKLRHEIMMKDYEDKTKERKDKNKFEVKLDSIRETLKIELKKRNPFR